MKLIILKYFLILSGLIVIWKCNSDRATKMETDKAAREKLIQDSLIEKKMADSIALLMEEERKRLLAVQSNENNSEKEQAISRIPSDAKFAGSESDTAIYKADGKILKEGYLSGELADVQRGDYLHLYLKDSLNVYHTFFLFLKNTKAMDKFWEGEYPAFNSKIRIHWKRERIQLEGTYATALVYLVDEMKILKIN